MPKRKEPELTRGRARDRGRSAAQYREFMRAARELGCDEDPAIFDKVLKKIASAPPLKSVQKRKASRAWEARLAGNCLMIGEALEFLVIDRSVIGHDARFLGEVGVDDGHQGGGFHIIDMGAANFATAFH